MKGEKLQSNSNYTDMSMSHCVLIIANGFYLLFHITCAAAAETYHYGTLKRTKMPAHAHGIRFARLCLVSKYFIMLKFSLSFPNFNHSKV